MRASGARELSAPTGLEARREAKEEKQVAEDGATEGGLKAGVLVDGGVPLCLPTSSSVRLQ